MSMQDDSPEYECFITISRVRSTEKTYMFCAAETMYVKKAAIEETE